MQYDKILENAFYLLALLNPASKVMFLATYEPALTGKQNFELSWKSSLAALLILIFLTVAGQFILHDIFRVELYSLQITGGLIVFLIGLTAVREGRFINQRERELQKNFTEISLVPLAAPLIAGPGVIAATIANSMAYGILSTTLSLVLAIGINFFFMLFAKWFNGILQKTHLLGPLIRMTGLVISAVAVQMVINGLKAAMR